MIRAIKADLLKIKRKWIWFLVFLGPFGVIALQAINYGVRHEYLHRIYQDKWMGLIGNVDMFIPVTLMLGIAILTSMFASIEHQHSSWKVILALPISRWTIYCSKFIIVFILLGISSMLLFLGTLFLGISLGYSSDFPTMEIIKMSFSPLISALPFLALQLWLATTFRNQAVALSVGVFGSIVSMFATGMVDTDLSNIASAVLGAVAGLILLLVSLADFQRRDVK